MKIWIDLTNSPHVNFFAKMITDLRPDHQLVLTCRPLANTIDLLKISGFSHTVVGKHYGANKLKKACGFPIRVLQLVSFLRGQGVDVAISHSSFYSPLVSRILGIPCIYLNDNEHAKGNQLAFAFADKILVPEFLKPDKLAKRTRIRRKIVQYPGVKEGVYLWNFSAANGAASPLDKIGLQPDRRTICIRPEPWTAQYYKGRVEFMDPLISSLADDFNVLILPRGENQAKHYLQDAFSKAFVLRGSVALADIVARCDLFIGAGGTMTRETAVLGIPTISIYQDDLLEVDRFLIQQGSMVHCLNPDREYVCRFMETSKRGPSDKAILQKGKQAYQLITDTLIAMAGKS